MKLNQMLMAFVLAAPAGSAQAAASFDFAIIDRAMGGPSSSSLLARAVITNTGDTDLADFAGAGTSWGELDPYVDEAVFGSFEVPLYNTFANLVIKPGESFDFDFVTLNYSRVPSGEYHLLGGSFFQMFSGSEIVTATFDGDVRLTVDAGIPAVPEPATWGMMLCGVGLVGVAMRRRPKAHVQFA